MRLFATYHRIPTMPETLQVAGYVFQDGIEIEIVEAATKKLGALGLFTFRREGDPPTEEVLAPPPSAEEAKVDPPRPVDPPATKRPFAMRSRSLRRG